MPPPMVRGHSSRHRGPGRGSPLQPPRPLTQTTLLGVPLDASDSEAFGHPFPSKPSPNTSIVTFQNVGPQPRTYGFKFNYNPGRFAKSNASLCLFAEHCLNESRLSPSERFAARVIAKNPHAFTYLVNNATSPGAAWNLTGGTGFLAHHHFLSHKTSHGADPTGLGRWVFLTLAGRHGSSVTFFSAYRPCRNLSTVGSVWNQHVTYFMSQGRTDPDPGALFDSDLLSAVKASL